MASKFVRELEQAAKKAATETHIPKVKIAPEPPIHSGGRVVGAIRESGLPVAFRSVVDHAALERSLERIGAAVPTGDSSRLVVLAERQLKGRAVEALSTVERQALEEALRAELVRLAPSTNQRRQELLNEAKTLFSAQYRSDVVVATAPAQGGTWVFFHDGSRTAPTVFGESFFPSVPGAPVPVKRPDPRRAGLGGNITWRTSTGRLVAEPPPLPVKAVMLPSGLAPEALEKAPDAVLEEVARARRVALEAAERQAVPVAVRAAPGTRRSGGRIASIVKRTPTEIGGVFDECIIVEGVTGPERPRLLESEMDKVLPSIGKVTDDPELQGMARMHVFGPIFGDETLAGLAYGPHEAANLLASGSTEGFVRADAKRLGRLNVKAGTPVTVTQWVKYRPIKGSKAGRYPFVVAVKYEYTLESGARVQAVIEVSPSGEVTFGVH
jgi:hypothetical protein